MTTVDLPERTHLAYTLMHEAYHANQAWNRDQLPTLVVSASTGGRGSAWEFLVVDYSSQFGGTPTLRVQVFNDAFAAFVQIPAFFRALARREMKTLRDVRALLHAMGAVDETPREEPRG